MQILDDAGHPDGRSPLTSAGSNYGLHGAPRGIVKSAGEWNSSRIVVVNNQVEHWLNGDKVVEYELGSADWLRRVGTSLQNSNSVTSSFTLNGWLDRAGIAVS
jgi:6-phosphofructokinase